MAMLADEFSLREENAQETGLPWRGRPAVRREQVEVAPGRAVSAIVWGEGPPRLVLLHGGAQNAHTWDTVCLALGGSIVALDLPSGLIMPSARPISLSFISSKLGNGSIVDVIRQSRKSEYLGRSPERKSLSGMYFILAFSKFHLLTIFFNL